MNNCAVVNSNHLYWANNLGLISDAPLKLQHDTRCKYIFCFCRSMVLVNWQSKKRNGYDGTMECAKIMRNCDVGCGADSAVFLPEKLS